MGDNPGDVLMKFGEDSLFAYSSQRIGPEGLYYTGFNDGHPGVVIRKFGEDQEKPYQHFPQNILVVATTLCPSKPLTTIV